MERTTKYIELLIEECRSRQKRIFAERQNVWGKNDRVFRAKDREYAEECVIEQVLGKIINFIKQNYR